MRWFSALGMAALVGGSVACKASASIDTNSPEPGAPGSPSPDSERVPSTSSGHDHHDDWELTCADRSDPRFRQAVRRDLDGDGIRDWIVMHERMLELFVVRDACIESRGKLTLDGPVAFVTAVGAAPTFGLRDLIVDTWADGIPRNQKVPRWAWQGRRYGGLKHRSRFLWTHHHGYLGVTLEDDIPRKGRKRGRFTPVVEFETGKE